MGKRKRLPGSGDVEEETKKCLNITIRYDISLLIRNEIYENLKSKLRVAFTTGPRYQHFLHKTLANFTVQFNFNSLKLNFTSLPICGFL